MRRALLALLACPHCGGDLVCEPSPPDDGELESGLLTCGAGHRFPIRRGIPRFVPDERYAASFGFEWLRHQRTQLDSANRNHVSEVRLQASLDFPLAELAGKLVLDAGCGMGRFMEVAARHGATVVGVDLSRSVEAAHHNLRHLPSAHVVQADLRSLPLKHEAFDLLLCLGVLHHTPNPRASFLGLVPFVKAGGSVSVTLYSAYNRIYMLNSRFWRRWTTQLPLPALHALSYVAVPLYHLWTLPGIGWAFRCLAFISLEKDWRWRVLDTFDWYSPRYQSWHSHPEVYRWFRDAGIKEVAVLDPSISLIGRRPVSELRPRASAP